MLEREKQPPESESRMADCPGGQSLLKRVRRERGLKAKELATMVGTDAPMISRIEHGLCLPIPEMMTRILEVLECEITDVFTPEQVTYKELKAKSAEEKKPAPEFYRLSARLPREAKDFILRAVKALGYKGVQEWVCACLCDLQVRFCDLQEHSDGEDEPTNDKQKEKALTR